MAKVKSKGGKRCTLILDWLDTDVAGYVVAKKLPAHARYISAKDVP